MIRLPRFGRKRNDRRAPLALDVERELEYHLERRAHELVDEGVDPDEAHEVARREFGDVEEARRYCARMSDRVDRRIRRRRAVADLGFDLRYALRGMLRNPGFTTVAVIIMALGIGANTAVFSIINAVVLQPLDYPEADRLVQVWETNRRNGSLEDPVSPVDLRDWQAQSAALENIGGYGFEAMALSSDGRPERVVGVEVSPEFFEVLAVKPALGRAFHPDEQGPDRRVVILGDRLWKGRFGADPTVVGTTVRLSGIPYVVVGVMPADFAFPSAAELWVPFTFDVAQLSRGQHFLFAVGRLAAGVSLAEAGAEMDAIAARLEEEYPQNNADQGIHLVPLQEQMVGSSTPALWIVFGAVALVLAIACGNVANMLIVRAAGRSGEIAVRRALGAGGWRLARQLLVESLALSGAAGILGLGVAVWGLEALVATTPVSLPRSAEIGIDTGMLAFALVLAMLTGLLFGSGPVLQSLTAARGGSAGAGARTSGGRGVRFLRDGLIVAEVAVTLVLLVAAGLLIANLVQLRGVDPGFDPGRVLTARVSLPVEKYRDPEQREVFVRRLLEEVSALPGVEAYGTVDSLPFSGSRSSSSFEIDGDEGDPGRPRNSDRREVTAGYFETMGIPLLRGRRIEATDTAEGAAIAVVNAAFERRFLSGDALGRRVRIGGPEEVAVYDEPVWREIVGVVDDIIHDDLTVDAAPEIYLPYAQHPSTRVAIAVRTAGPAGDLTDLLRDAVLRVDPDQPIYNVVSMEARLAGYLGMARVNAWALGIFSSVALVLAVLGIYSVVSYSVAQRTHELGIRVALGAHRGNVLRLVLRQGMTRVGVGLVLGLGGSLLVGRAVRSLLFNVDAGSPLAIGVPATMLAAAGLMACLVPALRAVRVDPVEALRRN